MSRIYYVARARLNAQAVGSIHARKYQHKVYVDIYQCIIYEGKPNGS